MKSNLSRDDIKLVIVSYYEAIKEYGHYLPVEVTDRLNSELQTIMANHESKAWCMLWWVWTHSGDLPEYLSSTKGFHTSFIAYLFGISECNPLPGELDLHFNKTSLFDMKRAFKLYCILQDIREMSSSKDWIDDDSLFTLSVALSPFSIEHGFRTLNCIYDLLSVDRLLGGKLKETKNKERIVE